MVSARQAGGGRGGAAYAAHLTGPAGWATEAVAPHRKALESPRKADRERQRRQVGPGGPGKVCAQRWLEGRGKRGKGTGLRLTVSGRTTPFIACFDVQSLRMP